MARTATITASATRKAGARPSIKAQQKAVEEAVNKTTAHKPSESIWVSALLDAGSFHRDALQLELAVGLSLFATKADSTKVGLDAKKALREVYEKAGYACKTPVGEDYKTVARRIGVAADLYTFIGGRETITDWVEDAAPTKHVQKIMEHLKGYNFTGINSVLAYIGKPVQTKRMADTQGPAKAPEHPKAPEMSEADKRVAEAASKAIQTRRDAEARGIPEGRVFTHGNLTVVVPFEASYDDVVNIAMELMTFAKTQMPLPVPVAAH